MGKLNKKKWSMIGGISGFIMGFWILFINKDMLGFFPAICGAILLIWRGETYGKR